jgi:hypothetical protein
VLVNAPHPMDRRTQHDQRGYDRVAREIASAVTSPAVNNR